MSLSHYYFHWCLCKFITVIIKQHIFRFEISIDDSFLMEVFQALDDLSDVKTGSRLIKPGVVFIHQVNMVPSGNSGQIIVGLGQL